MLPLIKGRPKHLPLQAWAASKALIIPASRFVQTQGGAKASAGTHARDGLFLNEYNLPESYSAAFDLSVLHPFPWSDSDIQQILHKFAQRGVFGWYRDPNRPEDGWHQPAHLHLVVAGVAMKHELQAQAHDWLNGLNGLVSHSKYHFMDWTEAEKQTVRAAFLSKNPSH